MQTSLKTDPTLLLIKITLTLLLVTSYTSDTSTSRDVVTWLTTRMSINWIATIRSIPCTWTPGYSRHCTAGRWTITIPNRASARIIGNKIIVLCPIWWTRCGCIPAKFVITSICYHSSSEGGTTFFGMLIIYKPCISLDTNVIKYISNGCSVKTVRSTLVTVFWWTHFNIRWNSIPGGEKIKLKRPLSRLDWR